VTWLKLIEIGALVGAWCVLLFWLLPKLLVAVDQDLIVARDSLSRAVVDAEFRKLTAGLEPAVYDHEKEGL
jgi:predicted RNase H-like nuclease